MLIGEYVSLQSQSESERKTALSSRVLLSGFDVATFSIGNLAHSQQQSAIAANHINSIHLSAKVYGHQRVAH